MYLLWFCYTDNNRGLEAWADTPESTSCHRSEAAFKIDGVLQVLIWGDLLTLKAEWGDYDTCTKKKLTQLPSFFSIPPLIKILKVHSFLRAFAFPCCEQNILRCRWVFWDIHCWVTCILKLDRLKLICVLVPQSWFMGIYGFGRIFTAWWLVTRFPTVLQ
jgi:hypothetical protein